MKLSETFIERTKKLLKDDWNDFLKALDEDAPISVRINEAKFGKANLSDRVTWCDSGYYLANRPSYTFDPLFHSGCYYPQEASSMFVEQVVRQHINSDDDIRMLDLCAAPGGKSTHLLSLLSSNSLLVSNEVIRTRANILSENIAKWGYANSIVTNNDPAEIGKLENYFDAILVDAPCSGEGMFRKDNEAANEWSPANVQLCKERQQRILADIWSTLKPNGILIYSTCTYNTDENEDNLEWICDTLGAEVLHVNTPDTWGISEQLKGDLPAYRFLPHKTKGEGFFIAAVRKNDADIEQNTRNNNKKKGKNSQTKKQSLEKVYQDYLKDNDNFTFVSLRESWIAIPTEFEDDYNILASKLRIVSAGVEIGSPKGKDFIPSQPLAFSQHLNKDAFSTYETDWETAIRYLKKEALVLPDDQPKGYVLLTYKNTPLGFVKNIGNRANNLYTQEWRIRSGNMPDGFDSFL